MELANIEKLLEKYFEATASVQEEETLKAYFLQEQVAPHLEQYLPIFQYFANEQESKFTKDVPLKPRKKYFKWISVAAILIFLLSIAFTQFKFGKSDKLEDYPEYAQVKEALMLVSENFNKGASHMNHLTEFENTTNKIFINQK